MFFTRGTLARSGPIVSMNPLRGIEAAVNRQPWAEGLPGQALDLPDVLAAYTRAPAWVEFQEGAKGQLAAGMLADLVLLDSDLFTKQGDEIAEVRPVLTVCDGRVVHDRT